MSEVKAFKMVGGDEVVAEVLSTNEATDGKILSYRVRRPHILQFQPMGQGQIGLAFVPWTLSNPTIELLDVPASAILISFSPSENVETQYLEQTSGISIVKNSSRISR